MVLNTQEKKTIVNELHQITKKSLSIILADTTHVSSNEITDLRKKSRHQGVIIKIVKNTFLNIAIKNTDFECIKNFISGPILIAYSTTHPGAGARLFIKFSQKNNNFKIKHAVFEKKVLSPDQIIQLSKIPTYEESIIHLIIIVKEAAAGKLIRLLNAVIKIKSNQL